MPLPNGTYAALLSGFADDGSFDPERQRRITQAVASQNIAGLYVGGSSAEDALMDTAELLEQQRVVTDTVARESTRLIAHVGRPSLRDSVRLATHAQTLGFDAVSALPPHAYAFSDSEILGYYTALAAATELPLIAYEIPVRTHRPLPLPLLEDIVSLPGVIGVKFTSTDLFKMSRLCVQQPDTRVFFGFDEVLAAAAVLGSHGGIGTTYNVLGGLYTALLQHVDDGQVDEARRLQRLSQDFIAELLITGVVPGVKLALDILGVDCGPARAPFVLKSDDARRRIEKALEAPGLSDWLIRP